MFCQAFFMHIFYVNSFHISILIASISLRIIYNISVLQINTPIHRGTMYEGFYV